MRYLRLLIITAVVFAFATGCTVHPVKQRAVKHTNKNKVQNQWGFETVLMPGSLKSSKPVVPQTVYKGFTYEPMADAEQLKLADVKLLGRYQGITFYVVNADTQTPPSNMWVRLGKVDTSTNTCYFSSYRRGSKVSDKQPRVLRLYKETAELGLLLELPEQDNTLRYKKGKEYFVKAWLVNQTNKDIFFNHGSLIEVVAIDQRKKANKVSVLGSPYSNTRITLKARDSIARTVAITFAKPGAYTLFSRVGCFKLTKGTQDTYIICDPPDIKTNSVRIDVLSN